MILNFVRCEKINLRFDNASDERSFMLFTMTTFAPPFLPNLSLAQASVCRTLVSRKALPLRKRHLDPRHIITCNVKNLLVVDIQELLRPDESQAAELKSFSERVNVDRSKSKEKTYVLYSSVSGYNASLQSIQDAELVQPDALVTLNGTELYQQRYRTPDPYWTQIVRSGWTSKPVEWVFNEFFKDEVERVDASDEFVVNVWCRQAPSADFCERAGTKLKEMGVSARVINGEDNQLVLVLPAAGSASKAVEFCQTMLDIPESNTYVFGGDLLVTACVQGKGINGICSCATKHQWGSADDRVFVSAHLGAKALLDGVVHHAIF